MQASDGMGGGKRESGFSVDRPAWTRYPELDNDAGLDARSFFSPTRRAFEQNQFFGTISDPVLARAGSCEATKSTFDSPLMLG